MSDLPLDRLLRVAGEGLVIVNQQGRIVAASDAAAAALGFENGTALKRVPPEELARLFTLEVPHEHRSSPWEPGPCPASLWEDHRCDRALHHRDPAGGWDRWVLIRPRPPLDDRAPINRFFLVQDITSCRRREQAARFLDEATRRLARSLSPDRALEHAAVVAVPYLADECVVAQRTRDERFQPVAWHLPGDTTRDRAQAMVETMAPLLAHVATEGRALLLGRARFGDELAEGGSTLVAPVRNGSNVTALLILSMAPETRRRHHPADRLVAEQLGQRIASAVSDAQLRQSEQRRLRAAEEREVFLAQLREELRQQLPHLLSACDRLEGALPDSERRVLNIVRQQARRLNTTIERLFPGAAPEARGSVAAPAGDWAGRPAVAGPGGARQFTARRT